MDYYRVCDEAWMPWDALLNSVKTEKHGIFTRTLVEQQLSLVQNCGTRNFGQLELAVLAHLFSGSLSDMLDFIDLMLSIFKSRRHSKRHVLVCLVLLKLVYDEKYFGVAAPPAAWNGFLQLLYLVACSPVTRETFVCDFRDCNVRGTSSVLSRLWRKMGFLSAYTYVGSYSEFRDKFGQSKQEIYNLASYLLVEFRYRAFYDYYRSLQSLPHVQAVNKVYNDIVEYDKTVRMNLLEALKPLVKASIPFDRLVRKLWRPHSRRLWVNCYDRAYLNGVEVPAYNIISIYSKGAGVLNNSTKTRRAKTEVESAFAYDRVKKVLAH